MSTFQFFGFEVAQLKFSGLVLRIKGKGLTGKKAIFVDWIKSLNEKFWG